MPHMSDFDPNPLAIGRQPGTAGDRPEPSDGYEWLTFNLAKPIVPGVSVVTATIPPTPATLVVIDVGAVVDDLTRALSLARRRPITAKREVLRCPCTGNPIKEKCRLTPLKTTGIVAYRVGCDWPGPRL